MAALFIDFKRECEKRYTDQPAYRPEVHTQVNKREGRKYVQSRDQKMDKIEFETLDDVFCNNIMKQKQHQVGNQGGCCCSHSAIMRDHIKIEPDVESCRSDGSDSDVDRLLFIGFVCHWEGIEKLEKASRGDQRDHVYAVIVFRIRQYTNQIGRHQYKPDG